MSVIKKQSLMEFYSRNQEWKELYRNHCIRYFHLNFTNTKEIIAKFTQIYSLAEFASGHQKQPQQHITTMHKSP